VSSARLTIPVTGRSITDPWWIRLEQEVIEDDSASLADAADLLDTLYNLDPCDDGTTEETADPDSTTTDETVEAEVRSIVCQYDENGNIDVNLMVYRSSPVEEYTLALQGGAIKTVETVTATVTKNIRVENAASITLDAPVLGNFSASWSGTVYGSSGAITPTITRVGNTIDFGGVTVKAGTIRVSYSTEYDLCTITVLGVDGEPGECTARAFYHGLVNELALEVPEPSEELGSCQIHWNALETHYKIECYRTVVVSKRCQCSEDEIDSYQYDEIVDCPDSVVRCPGSLTECQHFVGTVAAHEYVVCSNDETGRVSDPAYYEEVCCRTPGSLTLPQCEVKHATWKGGLGIEGGAQQYYDQYGKDLEIVPVSPPGGICGNWTITQKVGLDCCASIDPPEWDWTNSLQVLGDSSNGFVFWSASLGPYSVRIYGTGFTLEKGRKTALVSAPSIRVYTDADACGSGRITVTDYCGNTVQGSVRSINGQWVQVYDDTGSGPGVEGDCGTSYWCGINTKRTNTGTFGQYRSTVTSFVAEGTDPGSPWKAPWCTRTYNTACDAYAACDANISNAESAGYPVPALPDMTDVCDSDTCWSYCDYPMYIPLYRLVVEEWQC